MKSLKDILYKVAIKETHQYNGDTHVQSVCFDSREAINGCVFIAINGSTVNGHNFIGRAIEMGAVCVVCETLPESLIPDVTYIQVANSSIALSVIANNFYDNPSEKLVVIGITGTNGKTSTSTLLFGLFRKLGYSCGLLSTVHNRINDEIWSTSLTTPDALSIAKLMFDMVNKGCTHCFMEVSSIAIHQHRVAAIKFSAGIFTNLTHDHLDYHETFANYRDSKKAFFDLLPSNALALVNADDDNGLYMLQNSAARKFTYSMRTVSEFNARIVENSFDGLVLQIGPYQLHSALIGYFNAYNLLAVYATALILGEDPLKTLTALSAVNTAEGRFDTFKSEKHIITIVDYAHTPDALDQVLSTIQKLRTGNEQVITVVGCGGNRDKAKRPLMAQIAARLSDKVILTSDNPRMEDPGQIIEEMSAGVKEVSIKKVLKIVDRKEAIKTACLIAQPNDIILIAGKGHEKYQEIKGEKYPFDDKQIAIQFLNN